MIRSSSSYYRRQGFFLKIEDEDYTIHVKSNLGERCDTGLSCGGLAHHAIAIGSEAQAYQEDKKYMKKLAVIFPGIGYHADKPLLYYSRMIARRAGYEIVEVPYKNFPPKIRGDIEKMKQALEVGLNQAEAMLDHIRFYEYNHIVFISKSIGTAIASAYAVKHGLRADHLWYTPLAETFQALDDRQSQGHIIAFHGSADPWADTAGLEKLCRNAGIPLYLTEGGNHSLETGDAIMDLKTLMKVMIQTEEFFSQNRRDDSD